MLQNEQILVSRIAIRAQKASGTFEKQAQALRW